MHSKFFKHADVNVLQQELDSFLKELDEVTGQITDMKMLSNDKEIIVLVIYSCWKKI